MFFLLREDVTSGCSDATKWTARVGNVVVITRSRDKFRRAKKNSTRGKDTLDVKYSRRDSLRILWQAFVLSPFPRIFPLKPQFPFSSRFLASKSVLLESSRFPFIARACDAASRFPAKDTCSHIVESHTFSLFFSIPRTSTIDGRTLHRSFLGSKSVARITKFQIVEHGWGSLDVKTYRSRDHWNLFLKLASFKQTQFRSSKSLFSAI